MTKKVVIGFWWRCPNCHEGAYHADDKITKFCPYCGHEVLIQREWGQK